MLSPSTRPCCFEDAQTVRILRPGYITKEDLEQVAKTAILDPAILHDIQAGQTVRSPGMKYQHYSPQANVILVEGSDAAFCAYVSQHQTADCYALVFDGEEQNLSIPCLTYGKNSAIYLTVCGTAMKSEQKRFMFVPRNGMVSDLQFITGSFGQLDSR